MNCFNHWNRIGHKIEAHKKFAQDYAGTADAISILKSYFKIITSVYDCLTTHLDYSLSLPQDVAYVWMRSVVGDHYKQLVGEPSKLDPRYRLDARGTQLRTIPEILKSFQNFIDCELFPYQQLKFIISISDEEYKEKISQLGTTLYFIERAEHGGVIIKIFDSLSLLQAAPIKGALGLLQFFSAIQKEREKSKKEVEKESAIFSEDAVSALKEDVRTHLASLEAARISKTAQSPKGLSFLFAQHAEDSSDEESDDDTPTYSK